MIIAGIDPGNEGGIAKIDTERWTLSVCKMPTEKVGVNGSSKAMVDDQAARAVLAGVDHLFIEKVTAMPKNGAVSMFNFGYGFGVLVGVASGLQIPITKPRPQDWKKKYGLDGDKGKSILRASELMPACAGFWKYLYQGKWVSKDGLAEAALIALYGCHQLGITPGQPITPQTGLLAAE